MVRRRRPTNDEEWGIGDGGKKPPDRDPRSLNLGKRGRNDYDPPGEDMPDDQAGRDEYLPAVVPPVGTELSARVDPGLVEFAQDAIGSARAASTNRGYEADWERFKRWCRRHETAFLPASPETVVLYFSWLARDGSPMRGRRRGKIGYSIKTIERARSTLAHFHHEAGLSSPTKHPRVADLLKGLRRRSPDVISRARPLMPDHLAAILKVLETERLSRARYLRDRALLLVGFAAALRKSEIVALRTSDVRAQQGGLHVALSQQQGRKKAEIVPGTKYHAAGEGMSVTFEEDPHLVELGICPIAAAREWHSALYASEANPLTNDHPFVRKVKGTLIEPEGISSRKVERLVKEGAALIGLDPSKYGGHSLRAGCATYLIWQRKWNLFQVRDHLRHENVETLNTYVRDWDELPRGAS